MTFLPPTPDTVSYGGVLLRPPSIRDVPTLSQAVNDADIARWLPDLPQPCSESEAKQWIDRSEAAWLSENPTHLAFVVIDQATSQLIGALEILPIQPSSWVAQLGGWLRRDARGRGLGTTALSLAVRWAIVSADFERLRAIINWQNERARSVVERCGFKTGRECAGVVEYIFERSDITRLTIPNNLKFSIV